MEEQLISFETANKAEQKNFPFTYVFFDEEKVPTNIPTQSILQKWLREVHNIHIEIFHSPIYIGGWKYKLYALNMRLRNDNVSADVYSSYEEALERGLQKTLELIM